MLIDSHAHLYWPQYQPDLDEVIQRAKQAEVNTIINIGVDAASSQKALEQSLTLTTNSFNAFSSIGIHPHEAHKYQDDSQLIQDIHQLEQIYESNTDKVVIVGECGLDFFFEGNHDFTPNALSNDELKTLQRQLFQAQIDLARKLNLPLSIHCRDAQNDSSHAAWNEVINMISDSKGILHCYSGQEEITKKTLDLNFLISFAANITYPKNEYLREAAKFLPLEKIALETDCPFLAPQSIRGQRNEPNYVREIAYLISEIKSTSFENVANQTSTNVSKALHLTK